MLLSIVLENINLKTLTDHTALRHFVASVTHHRSTKTFNISRESSNLNFYMKKNAQNITLQFNFSKTANFFVALR